MSAKPIAKTNAKAPQKASKKVIVSKAPAIAPTLSKSRSATPKAATSKTARPALTEVKAPASTSTGKAAFILYGLTKEERSALGGNGD